MKKLIPLIITTLLLFSCLGLTAFAESSSVTISDDYQQLTLDGNTYSRFNTSMVEVNYFSIDMPVSLSTAQQELIDEVIFQINEDTTFIYAEIHFKDGAVLSVEFIRDDYLATYDEISSNQNAEYIIDFEWPEGNTVTTEKTNLFGDSVVLDYGDLEWCDYFPVLMENNDGALSAHKGSLLIIDEKCYYVNYEEIDVDSWYEFDPYGYDELPAYEVTNTDLLASIQEAEETYYADDFGFLYNDDLTETISAVFLILVFIVIPFAIFVVFLILAIRSKTVYKKMFGTICIFSSLVLIIVGIITSFVMMGR